MSSVGLDLLKVKKCHDKIGSSNHEREYEPMKRNRKMIALLLAVGMLVSSIADPAAAEAAKKKKPSVSTSKKTYTVEVGKTAKIQVKTKNVKKITSVKAKSSAKKNIKVSKVKKSKNKATVTVKALKAKSAKVTITVKYTVTGKKKTYSKKLKVTVKGKAKGKAGTKTPTPGSTPTKVPQTTATAGPISGGGVNASATPSTMPSAKPSAKPTASPTVRPTLRPTKEPVTANLVSVTNYKGTGNYCIEVTLDGEVDLSDSDFKVTRKPYGSTESATVTGFEVSRESAKSYVLDFDGGVMEDDCEVKWGDTLTVTIDSLTGTKKTGSVVKTGYSDGTTETQTLIVKAATGNEWHFYSNQDDLYGDVTYTIVEDLPAGITMEQCEPENMGNGWKFGHIKISVADTVSNGTYTVALDMEDQIGTEVTRVYHIMVVSETEIQINQYMDTITADGNYVSWSNGTIATVAGGWNTDEWDGDPYSIQPYSIQAEEIAGDTNDLSWNIELHWNSSVAELYVTGNVFEEHTYSVTVSATDNPEIKKTLQVTVKPGRKVQVSGTVRYTDNTPVDDLDPHVFFKNKETGVIDVPYGDVDNGAYEIELAEGTYSCYVVFYILGKSYYFYRTENVVITSQTDRLQDIDISCQIAAVKIDLTDFSDEVVLQDVPEDFSTPGCRLVVYPEEWYDKDNMKVPGHREVTLLPGEYYLHADTVRLYASNEYAVEDGDEEESREGVYWYRGEAHVIVAPEKITVEVVYKKADMEAQKTATMDMASGKVSFAADTENQVVKITPNTTGVYEIYTMDENMDPEDIMWHYGDNISVYREDGLGLFVPEDGGNVTMERLEAGKSYYVIVTDRCGEACSLIVAAAQQRKITGQVKDTEGNVLTFPGEKIELDVSSDGYNETTELKADGSYEANLYLGTSSTRGWVYLRLPGSNDGASVDFEINEENLVADITLCVITVQPPEKYKDCSIVYDEWNTDLGRIGWIGNVLYTEFEEEWIYEDTGITKVTITDAQGKVTTTNAFISFNHTGNQTVTAEFRDWEPNTDTVTSITAGKPVTGDSEEEQWYCFIPETDGLYQLDITNSDDNWYNVFNRYGEWMEEEDHSEAYTGEPLTYRMNAGEKYFIQVYPDGEYTLRVDKK